MRCDALLALDMYLTNADYVVVKEAFELASQPSLDYYAKY